ncbi:MAG: hypothetical protein LLF76_03115 [Planctomycetaceae bacterium]|nr:hypothetical protein [Planctomycetaceae bacterium]
MDSLSMVEIAAKQRHVLLLEKVKKNQALTAGELRELKEYEEAMARKKTKKKAVKQPPKPQAGVKRPNAVQLKNWAIKYETMADCEAGEGLGVSINSLMQIKCLKGAWERGQFLRKLGEAGKGNASLEEVEHDLRMADGTLEPLLEKDDEAREVFNSARFATIMKVRKAIVDLSEDKKLTPTTLRQLETFLRMQIVRKDVDFEKVPTAVMEDLFGVSRQTLIDWKKNRGMPFNADGSYNLRACLQQSWREKEDGTREKIPCWFERMLLDKIVAQPGKFSVGKQNDSEWLKNEKVRRQIAEMDRLLVPVERSLAGFLARAAAIDKFIAANGDNLYLNIAGLDEEAIKQKLAEYNEGIRQASCSLPANYPEILPESVAADFVELMGRLAALTANPAEASSWRQEEGK